MQLQEKPIECPYCGEIIEVLIDLSGDDQAYIEDCQVCCSPIEFCVKVGGDDAFTLSVKHENEA